MVDHRAVKCETRFVFDEPIRIVPDDGDNPMRGLLIGLAIVGRALGGARRRGLVRAAFVGVGIGRVSVADDNLDARATPRA